MVPAVLVLGALAQAVAWVIVASGRGSVWTTVGAVNVVAGVAAVAVVPPALAGRVGVSWAVGLGLVAGLALYAATAAFISIVGPRWPAFTRDARAIYRNRDDAAPRSALLAAGIVAMGEELFWRGATQTELARRLSDAGLAALATLVAYVLVDAPSRNLAIVAGAVVGGAVWGGLAWWSAGVLASVLAHATWTVLMLARPVVGEAA
jgi:membrane protease YdiL (CAAX protease family)